MLTNRTILNPLVSNINLSDLQLKHILSELKCLTGFDFSLYSIGFIKRRTEFFMTKNLILSESDLIYRINNSSNFTGKFLDNVFFQQFELFRDAEVWNFIEEKIIPKIIKKTNVKIHFPFSSGAEELYSFLYILNNFNTKNVHIFVTGVTDKHISKIKKGEFTSTHIKMSEKNIALLNHANDKDDIFIPLNENFIINHNFKGKLHFNTCDFFKEQNLLEFDMVFFQNKMIFFNSELKEKAISTIIRSIKKTGYIIIGEKEHVGRSGEKKIKQVDKKISLYKRKIFS